MKNIIGKIKELLALVVGTCLTVSGTGRTFVQAPMWVAVLAALASPHLAVVTALLVIAFGMRVSVVKA